MSLANKFDEYLRYMERHGASPATLDDYGDTYRIYVRDGYTMVDDKSVEQFLTERYKNPGTRNKRLGHLKSYAKWAGPEEFGVTVGRLTLRQDKLPDRIPEVVEASEQVKFMTALHAQDMMAFAHAKIMQKTGMRFTEVLNLRKSHFQLYNGKKVFRFVGKGRKERIIPVSQDCEDAFLLWIKLGARKGYPHENTIRYHYGIASRVSGVKVKSHWFRHGVASKLVERGHTYDEVADLLGNTVEVVRNNYARSSVGRLTAMTEAL